MICRARPKYIDVNVSLDYYLSDARKYDSSYENVFYFNRGSFALKFFLECWKVKYGRSARVGVQSLTCITVLDAIIKSGNIACLYDVSDLDCSIDFSLIKPEHNLDVLIVTHYQGIPNKDYEVIAEYCKNNEILLVEDCSHGSESFVNNIKIGTLSNVFIESYAWDKPYVCLHGGALVVNDLDPAFLDFFSSEFFKLPKEKEKKATSDILLLLWLMNFTHPENFSGDLDYSLFFDIPMATVFYAPVLKNNRLYLRFFSLFCKLLLFLRRIKPRVVRMHHVKISFLESQRKLSKSISSFQLRPGELNDAKELTFFETKENRIKWNRYSFIDPEGSSLKFYQCRGIQAGRYNWPKCLHELQHDNGKNVIFMSDFKNSEYISRHIVNLPLWHINKL